METYSSQQQISGLSEQDGLGPGEGPSHSQREAEWQDGAVSVEVQDGLTTDTSPSALADEVAGEASVRSYLSILGKTPSQLDRISGRTVAIAKNWEKNRNRRTLVQDARTVAQENDRKKEQDWKGNGEKSEIPKQHVSFASVGTIADISKIQYPEGVSGPRPDLNKDAKEGKFRYDRDFLLQFMPFCREKPASLPPLKAIGLPPIDPSSLSKTRDGSDRHRTPSVATLPPSRQASIGLGFSPSTLGKGGANFNTMGQFSSTASKLSSEDRFAASTRAASASGGPGAGMPFVRPEALTRTAIQDGAGQPHVRKRNNRGAKRAEGHRMHSQPAGTTSDGRAFAPPTATSKAGELSDFGQIAKRQLKTPGSGREGKKRASGRHISREMTENDAEKRIIEEIEEFLNIKNMDRN